jgi:membrane-bound lytic murein transglycosylase B
MDNINMKINKLHSLTLSLLLFSACSTQQIKKDVNQTESNIQTDIRVETSTPTHTINTISEEALVGLSGEFSDNWKLTNFIERMHTEHNFDYPYLYKLFSNAQNSNQVIIPCETTVDNDGNCVVSVKPRGKWEKYRDGVIYAGNIDRGIAFWEENEEALNRAYETYGVLPEFIIGILGIETGYGKYFGKKKVIDVLTTKAMLGDRRENFYTKQLEKYLVMTRQANLDASILMGSNAGAMGYGQFIASSYLAFAVDFNGDGVTDLWNAEDAIGSIASYFAKNGWNRNLREIATRAKYKGNRFKKLKTGYKTKYSQYKLRKKHKITARKKLNYKGPVSLIKLPKHAYDELWFGTHNFRVITTYNHSTFYGMTVYLLGQAVKRKRYGR